MRLMKRILSAAAVLALSASLLVGCSSGTASSVPVSASSAAESTVSSVEETASSAVDENEAAAAQLLNDLTGSYQELWPVILADEYKQTWLDDCTALVGEDNAEAAFEKLSSMVTGDVYGEDRTLPQISCPVLHERTAGYERRCSPAYPPWRALWCPERLSHRRRRSSADRWHWNAANRGTQCGGIPGGHFSPRKFAYSVSAETCSQRNFVRNIGFGRSPTSALKLDL